MNEINVEKIMDEIRAQIPRQEEDWAQLRFEDIPVADETETGREKPFDKRELDKCVAAASGKEQLAFFRPLPDGRVKGFAKRVVRKLIRFCVEPICLDASAFHQSVMGVLQSLRRFVGEMLAQQKRRDAEVALLRAEVEELRRRLDEVERKA